MSEVRVEHIGSLQRPKVLLDEVHRIYEAGHTALMAEERAKDLTHLHALEDQAIRDVVAKQEELGLPVVTDGEFRRLMYFNSFFDAVDGIAPSQTTLEFRGDDGSVVENEGPAMITGRVSKIDSPAAREAAFVTTLTDRAVKVTFPTASFVMANVAMGPGLAVYGLARGSRPCGCRRVARARGRRDRVRGELRAVRRQRLHDAQRVPDGRLPEVEGHRRRRAARADARSRPPGRRGTP